MGSLMIQPESSSGLLLLLLLLLSLSLHKRGSSGTGCCGKYDNGPKGGQGGACPPAIVGLRIGGAISGGGPVRLGPPGNPMPRGWGRIEGGTFFWAKRQPGGVLRPPGEETIGKELPAPEPHRLGAFCVGGGAIFGGIGGPPRAEGGTRDGPPARTYLDETLPNLAAPADRAERYRISHDRYKTLRACDCRIEQLRVTQEPIVDLLIRARSFVCVGIARASGAYRREKDRSKLFALHVCHPLDTDTAHAPLA
uniref:Uncharacterized protein n=1 Tax=Anopheles culicifacies TaxID=139723 RepID=A0A182LYR0_9DIPT